jgi:hypothetical protein
VLDDLLEVRARSRERGLEAHADLAIGFGDQRLQLAQRGFEVGALGLELLDVGQRFGVLVLRERVDGPICSRRR